MSKRIVPGINIQWPWSRLIADGNKSIETRGYEIPKQYLGVPLAIIETPGPQGREQGIHKARIIGTITFSESFPYKSKSQWKRDIKRHLVEEDSPFAYGQRPETWAWVISQVIPLRSPIAAPVRRGIVFTKCCQI